MEKRKKLQRMHLERQKKFVFQKSETLEHKRPGENITNESIFSLLNCRATNPVSLNGFLLQYLVFQAKE
jgi:hypothetical protein